MLVSRSGYHFYTSLFLIIALCYITIRIFYDVGFIFTVDIERESGETMSDGKIDISQSYSQPDGQSDRQPYRLLHKGIFTHQFRKISSESSSAYSQDIVQYHILANNEKVSFKKILNLFSDPSSGIHDYFNNLLRKHFQNNKAYFFECPAITVTNLDREFEFVLIPSSNLQSIAANCSPFQVPNVNPTHNSISNSNLTNPILLPKVLADCCHFQVIS